MTIRSLVLIVSMLAAGLTVISPGLALAVAMVVLTAWALVSFLRWREALRHRPTPELALSKARRPSTERPRELIDRQPLDTKAEPTRPRG